MLALLTSCFLLAGQRAVQTEDAGQAIAGILSRGGPNALTVEASARAILAFGSEAAPVLLDLLVAGQLSLDPGKVEPHPLTAWQEAIVHAALEGVDRASLTAFVDEVASRPDDPDRVAAALCVEGLIGRGLEVKSMARLLGKVLRHGPSSSRVDDAFEQALGRILARDDRAFGALAATWNDLAPEHASAALRALQGAAPAPAAHCLHGLLGRRPELETSVLVALAGPASWIDRDPAEDLEREVRSYLTSPDPMKVQAAEALLAKLRVPASVPHLLELLDDDGPKARGALAALRAISGTSLPDSPAVWRRWFESEEAWWRDESGALVESLSGSVPEGEAAEHLREASEHALHRDELAVALVPLLRHESPAVRSLTCHALRRLDSRTALPFLCARLNDADATVVSSAHQALLAIAQVELPPECKDWVAFLRQKGRLPSARPAE